MVATIAFLSAGLVAAAPAQGDRPPDARERAAIERVLRAQGFVSWEEIELDDDGPRWEVDDARDSAGRRHDVKLDPRTLRIVRRERDH
jgi:hypothetical protein